jgi:hypothetical protein
MPVSATKEERDNSEAVFCGNEVRASVPPFSLWILSKLRPNKGPSTAQPIFWIFSLGLDKLNHRGLDIISVLDHRRGVKACYAMGVQGLGFVGVSCHLMRETEAVFLKPWF